MNKNLSNENVVNNSANESQPMLLRRLGMALGLSALVAVPGFALAAPTNSQASADASYQLSYSASEFKSAESVKALHVRIRRIALDYCPNYGVTKNLSERASCIKDVETDLVSQVDHPLLTRLHSGETAMSIAGSSVPTPR